MTSEYDPRVFTLPAPLRELITLCGPPPKGAFPSGTRIVKVKSERGDFRPVGATGTAWACVHHRKLKTLAYIVQWDDEPGLPVAVIDWKIARAQ